MSSQDWQTLCAQRKQKQLESIPRDWIVQVPANEKASVIDFPLHAGLLSAQEIAITETTDLDVLLSRLATSEWSSVAVTTAFYKRAIIAQQLVSSNLRNVAPKICLDAFLTLTSPDQLSHGDFC